MVACRVKDDWRRWIVLFVLAKSADVDITTVLLGVEGCVATRSFGNAQMEAHVVTEGQGLDPIVSVEERGSEDAGGLGAKGNR